MIISFSNYADRLDSAFAIRVSAYKEKWLATFPVGNANGVIEEFVEEFIWWFTVVRFDYFCKECY